MSVPTSSPAPGTYTFAPAASDLVLYAYSLINIRPSEMQLQHYIDAAIAANFSMVNLTNHAPQQFAVETQEIDLVANTATYALATRSIAVPIVTILTGTDTNQVERTIGPLSRYEYRALPTKNTIGPVVSYFFDLQIAPQITFWMVPDGDQKYTAMVQTLRQMQDVDLTNNQGINCPYRFLDYLATDIAARLADSYQPAKSIDLYAKAEKRLNLALGRDQETLPLTISPALSGYWRVL